MANWIKRSDLSCTLAALAVILAALQTVCASSATPWPYLQVYPPVNDSNDSTPLYFALVLSTGGQYTSIGALPAVQIALDYVNSHPNILPGYSLHYTLADSQCNRATVLESYFHQMLFGPTIVGWVGSGCSVATEPTAEQTHFYNITQLSCISSSPELSDRNRFRYYFQLLTNELQTSQGLLGIIRRFGWKKVAIITQNENLFTSPMDVLKRNLTEYDIAFTEKVFTTDESLEALMPEPFDPDARIFVLAMYSPHARALLCEAYKQGLGYPKQQFVIYGWYVDEWWIESESERKLSCTQEEIAKVLDHTLATRPPEFYTNPSLVTEGGLTASEFEAQYFKHINSSLNAGLPVNLSSLVQDTPFIYAQHCHEATLAFAFALNKTISDLEHNTTLNTEAAQKAGLLAGDNFSIDHFTYNNSVVAARMFQHLQDTDFLGITGNPVVFNRQGTRQTDSLDVFQYHPGGVGVPNFVQVGVVNDTQENGYLFTYGGNLSEMDMWPDGIPNDGIPIEEVVTVAVPLTVVFVVLATAGLVFTVVCLAFNFIFRKRRLIRLSSPNLNYLIGTGAILLYADVILRVIPTTNPDVSTVLCNVTPWLTSLGYSLCYGTMMVKMARVWYIFNNPIIQKKYEFYDWHLALAVLCLVVIDISILGLYTLVEGVIGQLDVKRITNRENPEDIAGPTAEIHQYYIYVCQSHGRVALLAVLYGYKGLLQVIALLLAFRTRKVKAKGLNDSKYIAAAVYITSIVLAVTIVSTYTLADYVNVFPAVVGAGFLLGTTMILVLVFVPKMIGLHKDPQGKSIELTSSVAMSMDQTSGEAVVEELRREVSQLKISLRKYEMSQIVSNGNTADSDPLASKVQFILEEDETEIETRELESGGMEQGPSNIASQKIDQPDTAK